MPAVVRSATLVGVEAVCVRVEVDVSGGLPSFATVGLAEAAVRESRARVQAAIANSGLGYPAGRVTVNLAPAHLRKDGTGFDLPIALGVLAAAEELPRGPLGRSLVLGELSLSGRVRPVRGALAAAVAARDAGLTQVLVAEENGPEAALAPGIEVHTVRTLKDAVGWLSGDARPRARPAVAARTRRDTPDLADVVGQPFARRALEIAAAGGHHVLLVGGPGCGKTMLARRLPGILPLLDDGEALEVTRVHSAAGLLAGGELLRARPFRAPHHSTTVAGLVGGGRGPRPGELSLAHRGVLFLDELPEFARATLESLRQPLESGDVLLSRAHGSVRFPARVQLVTAMNPCPCARRPCRCAPAEVARYRGRASGPLVDRVDLHVEVPPVAIERITRGEPAESTASVRARVIAARDRAARRAPLTNAEIPPSALEQLAPLSRDAGSTLRTASERLGLSARGVHRVRRVARTIADLEGARAIAAPHLAEALLYRALEGR
jgi:magnesium chelatase family protein